MILQLFYVLVGHSKQELYVKIASDATVGELKGAIYSRNGDLRERDLVLYQAKPEGDKNGAWLTADEEIAKLCDPIQSKEQRIKYLNQELMMSPRVLLKEYFGDTNLKHDVHFLVDIPPDQSTPGSTISFKDHGAMESWLSKFAPNGFYQMHCHQLRSCQDLLNLIFR